MRAGAGPPSHWLATGVGFVIAATASALLLAATTRALGVRQGVNTLHYASRLEAESAKLSEPSKGGAPLRIAYLGDSTVADYGPARTLPRRLENVLNSRVPGGVRVANLSYQAMVTPAYYYVADRIAESPAEIVIWQISFSHFGDIQRLARMQNVLAGWIDWTRVPEALLEPLAKVGVTADRLLLYRSLVSAGFVRPWIAFRNEQSRVAGLRGAIEQAIAGADGTTRESRWRKRTGLRYMKRCCRRHEGRLRYKAARERIHFGDALRGLDDGHWIVHLLDRSVRIMSADGRRVIVYLNPINIEHLQRVDAHDEARIEQSITVLAETVEAAGGRFVDLHGLLRDEHFKDPAGHFSENEELDAPGLVVGAVARTVLDELSMGGRR